MKTFQRKRSLPWGPWKWAGGTFSGGRSSSSWLAREEEEEEEDWGCAGGGSGNVRLHEEDEEALVTPESCEPSSSVDDEKRPETDCQGGAEDAQPSSPRKREGAGALAPVRYKIGCTKNGEENWARIVTNDD